MIFNSLCWTNKDHYSGWPSIITSTTLLLCAEKHEEDENGVFNLNQNQKNSDGVWRSGIFKASFSHDLHCCHSWHRCFFFICLLRHTLLFFCLVLFPSSFKYPFNLYLFLFYLACIHVNWVSSKSLLSFLIVGFVINMKYHFFNLTCIVVSFSWLCCCWNLKSFCHWLMCV